MVEVAEYELTNCRNRFRIGSFLSAKKVAFQLLGKTTTAGEEPWSMSRAICCQLLLRQEWSK
jgi:hypothetical protein